MMVGAVCAVCRNWFVVSDGITHGVYTIRDGTISIPNMREGQYFRIVGSVFNDGVHRYPANDLTDETFDGAVWAMAVPPDFLALCDEIEAYTKTDAAKPTPYQSESFGGYSYTLKGAGSATGQTADPSDWRAVFGKRLNRWRKL